MDHLLRILESGGPVMIPLGLLSLVALALIVERFWFLRSSLYMNPDTISTLTELLASRRFSRAIDFCRHRRDPFADLVLVLIENRTAPYDEIKQILEDTARQRLRRLQRGLSALGTIVAGAPLLGLLGTVLGMIKIFSVIATAGSQVTESLSLGISEALITTATGLIIAIPALFTHSFLEARTENIISAMETRLLDMLHLVRRPPEDEAGRDEEEQA